MQRIRCGKIEQAIWGFEVFRGINFPARFSEYTERKDSLLLKWLYFAVPIISYAVLLGFLWSSGVMYHETEYFTYINDLGNSLVFTALHFISYFASVYYAGKVEFFIRENIRQGDVEDNIISKTRLHKDKKSLHMCMTVMAIILFCVACSSGYFFYGAAQRNDTAYWMQNLSKPGMLYYSLLLGVTWYHSLTLLGMVLLSEFVIFWCIREKRIIYKKELYNRNNSIMEMTDILLGTFSYGLFYIVGSILIILNDMLAVREGINNLFDNVVAASLLILTVIALAILVTVPLYELLKYMAVNKKKLIRKLEKQIWKEKDGKKKKALMEQRNEILTAPLIYTSLKNRLLIITSVVLPLAGIVLQVIELIGRKN